MSSLSFSNLAGRHLQFVDLQRGTLEVTSSKIYLKCNRKGLTVSASIENQVAYANDKKSIGVAYIFLLLLGIFGAHRFYAGKKKSAIAQLILLCTGVGLLVLLPWLLADLFLVPGMVREHNLKLLQSILVEGEGENPGTPRVQHRKPASEAERKRQAMLEDLRSIGYRKERRDTSHLYR